MVLTLMLSIRESTIFATNSQLVIALLTAAVWPGCRDPGGVAPRAQLVRAVPRECDTLPHSGVFGNPFRRCCVTKESVGSKIIRPAVEAQ